MKTLINILKKHKQITGKTSGIAEKVYFDRNSVKLWHPNYILEVSTAYHENLNALYGSADIPLTVAELTSNLPITISEKECFPVNSVLPGTCQHLMSVDPLQLAQVINYIYSAMAKQDVRYYLNGICLELNADSPRLIATDGHRMHWQDVNVDTQNYNLTGSQYIIPRDCISMIQLILKTDKARIGVTLSEDKKHITFYGDGWRMIVSLVDGRFPDYRRVIPTDKNHVANMTAQQVAEAIKIVKQCQTIGKAKKEKWVTCGLLIKDNQASFMPVNQLPIENEVYSISAFECTYLLDTLANCKEGAQLSAQYQINSSLLVNDSMVVMPVRL